MSIDRAARASASGAFDRFADGRPVGDVIPFYDEGVYHLFILTPPEGSIHFPERLRTTWRHITSRDLVHWAEEAEAVVPDPSSDIDSGGIWTGSVIKAAGEYHLFYTGHQVEQQTICHATSSDGIRWRKNPANPISRPDPERFEAKDWRDPFVFYNEEEGVYWMLITSRLAGVAAPVRGVIALSASPDLVTWSQPEIYYRTFLTHAPECPEVFRLDGRWVLGYSRFTDRRGTVYRVSESLRGPWRAFGDDTPDGAGWYAAKGLSDDAGRRIAFGWIPDHDPTRANPSNPWLWAGDLGLPRQLSVTSTGVVAMRAPDEVLAQFGDDVPFTTTTQSGDWTSANVGLRVRAPGDVAVTLLEAAAPQARSVLTVTFDDLGDAHQVGVIVHTNAMLDSGIGVLLSPRTRSIRLHDMIAPPSKVSAEYESMFGQYAPVASHELAAPIDGPIEFTVVARGDTVEAFVAGESCLTYRAGSSEFTHAAVIAVDASCTVPTLRWRTYG